MNVLEVATLNILKYILKLSTLGSVLELSLSISHKIHCPLR